jgi:hypothetical protein
VYSRLLPLLVTLGCAQSLPEGEWGTFRYFGELRGEPPMRLLPPHTDRNGNAYVLFGNVEGGEDTQVFTGTPSGDWSSGCTAHRGVTGLRGFVGRTDDMAWYWSGDSLVSVSGETGSCNELLTTDPVTLTELYFEGVIPAVDETPSRRSMVALVQGSVDSLPFHVVIDLDQETYSESVQFTPSDASGVVVLGTGASATEAGGVLVVAYTLLGDTVFEAIFVGRDGSPTDRVVLDLDPELAVDGAIEGFVQNSEDGLWVGLLSDGNLLLFDDRSGGATSADGMSPVGVQAWNGELFLTGLSDGTPVIAEIKSSGELDSVRTWTAAVEAQQDLANGIRVRDERHSPTRRVSWNSVETAIGSWPLVTPHPLDVYTLDSTSWLVAGPGYDTGVEPFSAVAFAPVGVRLP